MKRWMWGAAVLLLAGAAALWWWQRAGNGQPDYRTATVERGLLQGTVSAAGTVMAVSQVQVGSQVSGQIMEVLADFNSSVRRGELIARLDPKSFEHRVQQAEADVEAARAAVLTAQAQVLSNAAGVSRAQVELQQSERDLARNRDLVAQQFISPVELERSQALTAALREAVNVAQAQLNVTRAQARNAEAVVRQREAQLAQAKVDLARTQIRSPVDGIVIKRSIEPGQTVAASLQSPELFVIARNLQDMQVEVPVDEADIGRVSPGQKASFTVDAYPGRPQAGEVRQVRKAAVNLQNVVTYTVVVGFDNSDGRLLPGMTANVRIITASREAALKVPNAALRMRLPTAAGAPAEAPARRREAGESRSGAALADAGGNGEGRRRPAGTPGRVHVLVPGEAQPRTVSLRLGISDGAMTEVLEGELKEGDEVIVGTQGPRTPVRPGGPRLGMGM